MNRRNGSRDSKELQFSAFQCWKNPVREKKWFIRVGPLWGLQADGWRGCCPENLVGYCHNQRKWGRAGRLPSSSFLSRCHASLMSSSSTLGGGVSLAQCGHARTVTAWWKWTKRLSHVLKVVNHSEREETQIFFFWVVLHGMWDLNSPTRDRNCDPSGGSRVLMLDHQGSPKSSNLGGPLACLGGPPDRGCRCYFLTQKCQPSSCRCPGHLPVCVFPKPSCVLFWALTSGWGPSLGTCSSCWRQALPESHLGSSYPSSPTYGTTGWHLFGVHGSLWSCEQWVSPVRWRILCDYAGGSCSSRIHKRCRFSPGKIP